MGTTRIVASALRSLLISATTLVRFTFLHLSPSPHPLPHRRSRWRRYPASHSVMTTLLLSQSAQSVTPLLGFIVTACTVALLSLITVVITSAAYAVRIILLHTLSPIYYLHQYNIPEWLPIIIAVFATCPAKRFPPPRLLARASLAAKVYHYSHLRYALTGGASLLPYVLTSSAGAFTAASPYCSRSPGAHRSLTFAISLIVLLGYLHSQYFHATDSASITLITPHQHGCLPSSAISAI